jgi:hypothetical protein
MLVTENDMAIMAIFEVTKCDFKLTISLQGATFAP